jgi:hypothetical protein
MAGRSRLTSLADLAPRLISILRRFVYQYRCVGLDPSGRDSSVFHPGSWLRVLAKPKQVRSSWQGLRQRRSASADWFLRAEG